MNDPFDDLLFPADWPPERVEALRAACASDPDLAQSLLHWQRLRAHLRAHLDAAVPDRSLLVLHALDAAGRSDVFSDAERAALAEARPDLRRALQAHPALEDVVRAVQDEAAAFDRLWAAHLGTPPRRREDLPPRRRRRGAVRWAGRLAMGLAVVVFAVVAVLLVQRDRSYVTVETAADEVRLITLADGSTVRLMGGSALTFTDPARDVAFDRRARLEGRAFFEIAGDRAGFVVETSTAQATVLGTRFGVVAEPAVTEVVLAAGRLSLAPRSAPSAVVVLEPGQMSRVADRARPSTPTPVDVNEALDWTGLFVFDRTAAKDIAARLSAHYRVAVEVAPALRDEAVTGTFERRQALHDILSVLAAALDARLEPLPEGGFRVVE